MKKNDLAAIILIVALAGVIAYFAANALIGTPENTPVQVESVTSISDRFPAPDPRIFNERSIDPTVEITGGGQSTDTPFTN